MLKRSIFNDKTQKVGDAMNQFKPVVPLSPSAAWILEEIKKQGRSVFASSKRSHITQTAIKGWKKGSTPQAQMLLRAAEVLNREIPPDLLPKKMPDLSPLPPKSSRKWVYTPPAKAERSQGCQGCHWIRDGQKTCLLRRCLKEIFPMK